MEKKIGEKMEDRNKFLIEREPEWTGSIWKHPYMLYILLTSVLFLFLLLIAWLGWSQGWIPNVNNS